MEIIYISQKILWFVANMIKLRQILCEVLKDELIKKAKTIKHCGDYGMLFYNPKTKEVHWTAGDGDGDTENGQTDLKEIEKMLKLTGITHVEIGDEWSPNNDEDEEAGWERLL